jgi:hypothetical protein
MDTEDDDVSIPENADIDATVLINEIVPDAMEEVGEARHGGEAAETAKEYAHRIAEIQAKHGDDGTKSTAKAALNDIADVDSAVTRSDVKNAFYDRVDAIERKQRIEEGDMVFQDLVAETMDDVTKHLTTDHVDDPAYYTFTFELPDDDDTEVVHVMASEDAAFSKKRLWKAFIGATENHYPERREESDDGEGWDNHLGNLIEEVGETVKKDIGPRTAALMQLANKVNRSPAFANVQDAVENGGVYVDDEPPNHDEIWIPSQMVAEAKRDEEISSRKMQMELERRGLNALPGDAVSDKESLPGRQVPVWKVKGEFVPEFVLDDDDDRSDFSAFAGFVEEAETASDRMDDAVRKARGGPESSDDDTDTDDDDDDGAGDGDDDADSDGEGGEDDA